jgi:hypothetical protein
MIFWRRVEQYLISWIVSWVQHELSFLWVCWGFVSKARSISRRFVAPFESQLCKSHCISIFLRFLVISDSRAHSYFPVILLISAMLNLYFCLFSSQCSWWIMYSYEHGVVNHHFPYANGYLDLFGWHTPFLDTPIYISSYLSYFHPFSQLQVGKSHVPRSSRRFATILATAAGSGPAGVHAQSVQYNAQLGGAPLERLKTSGTKNQMGLFEHMVSLNSLVI